MRLGTVLKTAAALAAAATVALVAVVKSIDVDAYGRMMAEAATAEFGRELRVRGDFQLQLSLHPRLVATEVVLANAPGGSRAEMLRIGRIEAEIGLLPLLRREIRVERLVLSRSDLLLENGNWSPAPAATPPAAGPEAPATTVMIGQVLLENAQVTLRGAGGDRRLEIERATLTTEGGPLAFDARGALDGRKLDLSGVIGSLGELRRQSKPFPVKMQATVGGVVAVVDGVVGHVDDLGGIDAKLSLEANEAAELAGLWGAAVPEMGPLRLAARLTGAAAAPELTDIEAAVGRKDAIRVTAKGAVKAPLRLDGVDLALAGDSVKSGRLLALLGVTAEEGPPVRLSGRLTRNGGPWSLANIKATAGQSDLVGAATLKLDGARPAVSASLASTRLDLAELGVAPVPQAGAAAAPAGGRVFSDTPFALAGLGGLDADLTWTGETLVLRGLALEKADLRLRLLNGVLTVKPATASLAEGTVAAEAVLDARKEPAALRAVVTADRVDLGRVLAASGLSGAMSGGTGDLRLDLSGTGATMRQLMGSLDGETSLVVGRARIDGGKVDLLAFDVMRQLSPWTPGEAGADLNCFVARFAVAKGVATSKQLLFDTSHMTMGGDAIVDLGGETVQATLVPRPKQASLMNLATPMDVSGPLTAPSVVPNKLALATDVALGAVGAVIAPPLALLPFVTAGQGEENPCLEALKQAKQPAGKPAPKPKGKQGLALPDVGGAITDLFGGKKK